MVTKIDKGTRKGLPLFFERHSYFHNEKDEYVQINYVEFCETPNGERVFEESRSIVLQDKPEIPEKSLGEGKSKVVVTPAIPAVTEYTDHCKTYGSMLKQRSAEIDAFLKALEV